MANEQEKNLKTLHDLIATCHDAEEGYGKAAKGLHKSELSDKLAQLSGDRRRFADEISAEVAKLGSEHNADLHEGGILHRGWVDLEARIRPKDDQDLLQDCINGDGGTLKHYDRALDQNLSDELRTLLNRQRSSIEDDIEFLKARIGAKAQHA